jgi:hypothetical protein
MPGYENLKDRDDQAIPQHQTEDGTASEATKGSDYADWSASVASAAAQGFKPVVYAALTNSPQPIKASKGKLAGWDVENPGGTTLYLQFFRKPHDTVTLGTDAPYMVVPVPSHAHHARLGLLDRPGQRDLGRRDRLADRA